jgi:sugar-specific transcriptional regulator TrmB
LLRAPKQDEVHALTDLGLTLRQAKVYTALLDSGNSTIKTISQISRIARPDIYRTTRELQILGLIEKIIDKPVRFKATPINAGISILLNCKIQEINRARQEAKELLNKYMEQTKNVAIQDDTNQFVLIPEKKSLILRLKKAIIDAKSGIDVVCPKEAFPRGLLTLAESYEKAIRRGVKIRWIIEKPTGNISLEKTIPTYLKTPLFSYRTIEKSPQTRFGLFDRTEIFIATNPTQCALESSALWTNNPSILKIVNDYFEILWITGMENSTL